MHRIPMDLRWPVSRVRRVYMRPPFLTSPKSCRSINTLRAITTISIHQRPFARARARGQKCSMSLALCRDSRIAVSTSSAVPLRAAARGDVPTDLFAHASTCRARLPKIVRSYAIDAIERDAMRGAERTAASPDALRERATTLVDTSLRSPRQQFPSIGSGETWRLAGGHLSGGALTASDELLHLSAFLP